MVNIVYNFTMNLSSHTVGQRMKELRQLKGYTLEDVARAINKTPTTVSKYEADRVKTIPQRNLNAIAKFLDVKPSYLLGYEDDEHASTMDHLSISEQLMIQEYRRLSIPYQRVVDDMIQSLLRAQNPDDEPEQLTL